MKSSILFPHRFKIPAFIIFIPSLLAMIGIMFFDLDTSGLALELELPVITESPFMGDRRYFVWVKRDVLDLILLSVLIISGILFAFSKEPIEDEMIASIRKDSLIWAVYLNYGMLLVSIFAFAGLDLFVILALNILSLLIFFMLRFQWQKRILKDSLDAE
ncbi:hypothetical protein [Nonlabens sp. YIK11]|uniref:hypothetical protein n=1 Tax=Nonlabens sp. YIK11 TaxID=1453349 RepID=UPI0006DD2DBF|nr:hypothetical protein [Nonlabens sp. YIK11]